MTIVFTATILVMAWLVWSERNAHVKAEEAWRVERAQLLNRIQPEVYQPAGEEPGENVQAVSMFDDEAYWKATA